MKAVFAVNAAFSVTVTEDKAEPEGFRASLAGKGKNVPIGKFFAAFKGNGINCPTIGSILSDSDPTATMSGTNGNVTRIPFSPNIIVNAHNVP